MLPIEPWLDALQNEDKFPLSVLPHVGLFLTEEKDALRLVVSNKTAFALYPIISSSNLYYSQYPIQIATVSDSWSYFTESDLDTSTHMVIVIARNETVSFEILEEEIRGDYKKAGKMLGYPICCINGYADLADQASYWVTILLQKSSNQVSFWCNRAASMWGGTCSSGELFPCSLTCKHAINYGKKADKALRDLGVHKIADTIIEQAKRTMYLYNTEILLEPLNNAECQKIDTIDA
jgi:hypothetical protein